MNSRLHFWTSGIATAVLFQIAAYYSWLGRLPFVGTVAIKPGPPGKIAIAIVFLGVWVVLAMLIRFLALLPEQLLVNRALRTIKSLTAERVSQSAGNLEPFMRRLLSVDDGRGSANTFNRSELRERLLLLQQRARDWNRSERLAFLATGASGLSSGRAGQLLVLMRAVVWTMPGLGFVATTLEMARAVGGMGQSIGGTSNYEGLRDALVREVIPHIAGAFDITVLGLGASVASYMLIALVNARQEHLEIGLDEVSLNLLAKLPDPTREDKAMAQSTEHLEEVIEELADAVRGLQGGPGPADGASVQRLEHEVKALNESIDGIRQSARRWLNQR